MQLTFWKNVFPLYEIKECIDKEVDMFHAPRVKTVVTKTKFDFISIGLEKYSLTFDIQVPVAKVRK